MGMGKRIFSRNSRRKIGVIYDSDQSTEITDSSHRGTVERKKSKKCWAYVSSLSVFRILKRSLDARKKPVLFYVYTVEAEVKREKALKHKIKNPNIFFRGPIADYKIIPCGEQSLRERPVVIGSGPRRAFLYICACENGISTAPSGTRGSG